MRRVLAIFQCILLLLCGRPTLFIFDWARGVQSTVTWWRYVTLYNYRDSDDGNLASSRIAVCWPIIFVEFQIDEADWLKHKYINLKKKRKNGQISDG